MYSEHAGFHQRSHSVITHFRTLQREHLRHMLRTKGHLVNCLCYALQRPHEHVLPILLRAICLLYAKRLLPVLQPHHSNQFTREAHSHNKPCPRVTGWSDHRLVAVLPCIPPMPHPAWHILLSITHHVPPIPFHLLDILFTPCSAPTTMPFLFCSPHGYPVHSKPCRTLCTCTSTPHSHTEQLATPQPPLKQGKSTKNAGTNRPRTRMCQCHLHILRDPAMKPGSASTYDGRKGIPSSGHARSSQDDASATSTAPQM